MKPDQQAQGEQPTSMTGSDWQRQALTAARSSAAGQKAAANLPDAETVKKRIEAQQVPDMLAAVDPQPLPNMPEIPSNPVVGAPGTATSPPAGGPGNPVVGTAANDEPMVGTPVISPTGTSGFKKFLIVFIVLLLLGGGGAGAYFMFFANKDKSHNARQQAPASTTVDLSTLSNAVFVAPSTETGFTQSADKDGVTTQLANADKTCTLAFGITPKAQLPTSWQGKTAGDIINLDIEKADTGGQTTVDIDSTGYDLVLQDAVSTSKRYRLPIRKFDVRLGDTVESHALSVAVLQDGAVASVSRVCKSASGAVPKALVQSFDSKAAQITVRVGNTSATN